MLSYGLTVALTLAYLTESPPNLFFGCNAARFEKASCTLTA